MNKTLSVALVGGDMRQAYLCELLKEDGNNVSVYGLHRYNFDRDIQMITNPQAEFAKVDAIILPMPVVGEEDKLNAPLANASYEIDKILNMIPSGKLTFGGAIDKKTLEKANQRDIEIIDYLKREELAILNAIPTSEGAIQIAMEELPITLHGASVLITGYGRIGKILAHNLKGLGCKVCIAARKQKDFALAYSVGIKSMHINNIEGEIDKFDLIINTVPAPIFTRPILAHIKKHALVIDVASKPGGEDVVFG